MRFKTLFLVSLYLYFPATFAFECRVLPFIRVSEKEIIENDKIEPRDVKNPGECIDYAESLIGSSLKNKEKAQAVDFIIHKKDKIIRGTVFKK